MRTIETVVYKYSELSPKAQEKARDWYRGGCLDYDWWKSTYEDAQTVGLKIKSFDTRRRNDIQGEFINGATECATAIIKEHGPDCDTTKLVSLFLADRQRIETHASDEENIDESLEAVDTEFLRAILKEYLHILRNELEWIQADEQVIENIEANDYEFEEDGSLA